VLDGDTAENLIKFTPTKEEIELLKVSQFLFYLGYLVVIIQRVKYLVVIRLFGP